MYNKISTVKILEQVHSAMEITATYSYGEHLYNYVNSAITALGVSLKDIECMQLWVVPHIQVERLRASLGTPTEVTFNKVLANISPTDVEQGIIANSFRKIIDRLPSAEFVAPIEGTIWLKDKAKWIVWDKDGVTLMERPQVPNEVTDSPIVCPFCGSTEIKIKPLNKDRDSYYYACQPCPGVFFEYYDSDDVELLRNKLN